MREVSESRKNSRKKAGRRKKGRERVKISMTCCKTNKILFVQSTNVFYKGCMYYILNTDCTFLFYALVHVVLDTNTIPVLVLLVLRYSKPAQQSRACPPALSLLSGILVLSELLILLSITQH